MIIFTNSNIHTVPHLTFSKRYPLFIQPHSPSILCEKKKKLNRLHNNSSHLVQDDDDENRNNKKRHDEFPAHQQQQQQPALMPLMELQSHE